MVLDSDLTIQCSVGVTIKLQIIDNIYGESALMKCALVEMAGIEPASEEVDC